MIPHTPLTIAEVTFNCRRDYLLELLPLTNFNVTKAARIAGVTRAALYQILKGHGIAIDRHSFVAAVAIPCPSELRRRKLTDAV